MSSEMREFREALQDCVRAMDVARDTIQPITTAQIRLHNLNPQTDKLLDDAAAKALALLARTEAGAPHHPLAICPTCKDYYEVCECTPDAAPVADGNFAAWFARAHPVTEMDANDGDNDAAAVRGVARAAWCAGINHADTHPQDASAGDGIDWKWQYRFQTVMRFMDNGATREAAERAAAIDVASLEGAALQQKGTGNG